MKSPEFWEEMYRQTNLKQVYFAGGEPFMIKEHKKFIEEIIRQGYPRQNFIEIQSKWYIS